MYWGKKKKHLAEARIFFFFFWPHCMGCAILVPPPGIEPRPSAVKARSPKTGLLGNSKKTIFFN